MLRRRLRLRKPPLHRLRPQRRRLSRPRPAQSRRSPRSRPRLLLHRRWLLRRLPWSRPKAATGPIDFDAFRKALEEAKNNDELNAIYDREITDRGPPLSGDEVDEADNITREVGARFWEGDGQ